MPGKYHWLADIPVEDKDFTEHEVTRVTEASTTTLEDNKLPATRHWYEVKWLDSEGDPQQVTLDAPGNLPVPKTGDRVRVYFWESEEDGGWYRPRGVVVGDVVWWYLSPVEVKQAADRAQRATFVKKVTRLARRLAPDEQARVMALLADLFPKES